MFVQVLSLVETCHCTVGVGVPVAAAVKVAWPPKVVAVSTGDRVTVGADWGIELDEDVDWMK